MSTDQPNPSPPAAPVSLPASAWIMAILSALFVMFGLFVVVILSAILLGEKLALIPPWLFALYPLVALILGILSGWQSLKQAKRKLQKKQAAEQAKATVPCKSCGEAIPPNATECPMCGASVA